MTRMNMQLFTCLQTMKQEHSQLSHEAHRCASSVPDLNNMVFAVQALGKSGLALDRNWYRITVSYTLSILQLLSMMILN